MKRGPTQEEREKIVRAIAAGDRIRATSSYISITECGLTEAQKFIKALTTELGLENPEKFAKRQQRDIGSDFGFPDSVKAGQLDRFQFQCADPL
jgi:hypothetical protein